MARRGGGRRRTGGGQGFTPAPRQPDQIRPNGRVRTAAGGTRNRGGALVAPAAQPSGGRFGSRYNPESQRRRREFRRGAKIGQRIAGLSGGGRTVNVGAGGGLATRSGGALATRGGALARGGTGGLVRTSNDPYRGSSARSGRSSGLARRRGGARTRTTGATGGVSPRRAAAIRELAQRGATPGERAAAQEAARRLGI